MPLTAQDRLPINTTLALEQLWRKAVDIEGRVSDTEDLLTSTSTTQEIADSIKAEARNAFTYQYPIELTSGNVLKTDNSIGLWSKNGTAIYYNAGYVGIGINNPQNYLHIRKAVLAGASYPTAAGLVIEGTGSDDADIYMFTSPGDAHGIWFGDDSDNNIGAILYDHNVNSLLFRTNDNYRMYLDSTGQLGLGVSTPGTLLELNSIAPYITLQNTTDEYIEGGSESKIIFEGNTTGQSVFTIAQIQASHDGAADDKKGDLIFSTSDATTLTERMRIDSAGYISIFNRLDHIGDTDTYLEFGTDTLNITVGNVNFIDIIEDDSQDKIEFNTANTDVDFIFNTTVADTLFIQGNNGYIGINTNNPDTLLHIYAGDSTVSAHSWARIVIEDDDSCMLNFLIKKNKYAGLICSTPNNSNAAGLYARAEGDAQSSFILMYLHGNTSVDNKGKLELNGNINTYRNLFTNVTEHNSTNLYQMQLRVYPNGGILTNRYGLYFEDKQAGGGTITNTYAMKFDSTSSDFLDAGAPTATITRYLKVDIGGALYKIKVDSEA